VGVPYRVVRFTTSTASAGNTQDITVAGETRTAKLVLFHICNATADATSTNDHEQGWGAYDGTSEWSGAICSEDAQANSTVFQRYHTDSCLSLIHSAAGTSSEALRFSGNSLISGGVRLDIDVAAGSAYKGQAFIFFEGDFEVGTHSSSGTVDTQTTQTGMGFDPSFVLLWDFDTMAFSTTIQTGIHISQGYVANNATSGTLQCSTTWYDRESASTSDVHLYTSTATYGSGWIGVSSGLTSMVEYGFTSGGFTATTRLVGQSHRIGYVAGDIPGNDVWAGDLEFPTSTGDHDFTEPNVEAVGGFITISGARPADIDSWVNGGSANPFGQGMWTYADESCIAGISEHNRTTMDTGVYTDDTLLAYEFATGTLTHESSHVGSIAGGFRINAPTTVNGFVRHMPCLAFGPKADYESIDETMGITEVVLGLARQAIDETMGITEEVGSLLRQRMSGRNGQGAFARVEAGQGGYNGVRGMGA